MNAKEFAGWLTNWMNRQDKLPRMGSLIVYYDFELLVNSLNN